MDRSPPHRRRWRGRAGAAALSAGLHAALFTVLLLGWRTVAPPPPGLEIPVSLAAVPLPPAPKPPAPQPAAPAKPAPTHKAPARPPAAHPTPPPPVAFIARRSPAPRAPTSPPAVRVASRTPRANLDQLVDSQLAAAREAAGGAGYGAGAGGGGSGNGAGGGGGECDMASRVQAALRKDPLARAAMHAAGSGRSILIWNGDWVQSGAEDGKGLAAVREAITWEVAFAPAACRHQRVHGPILLSLNDGSPQVELVAGEWRWSDLLGLR